MDATQNDLEQDTEIGVVVFDDEDAPADGWLVGDAVKRIDSPPSRSFFLGNQRHAIRNGPFGGVLPSTFLPLGLRDIAEEWDCRPTGDATLMTTARLVRRILAIALRLAKASDTSVRFEDLVAEDSLTDFFAKRLAGMAIEILGEDLLIQFENGEAPDHYLRVSARRPRLQHLAEALSTGQADAHDPLSGALLAFAADPANAGSWSAGIVAEAVTRALPGGDDLERVMGENLMLAMADFGYPISYEPGGRITAMIHPYTREAFVRTMMENGLVPDDGALDAELREACEDFAWGGDPAAEPGVRLALSRRRDLLWNLDRLPLVR